MRTIKISILLAFLAAFLQGCAATGSSFTAVDTGPSDKAVVYFYRPKMFAGSAASLAIVDNEQQIASIQNGQYIRYVASPGKHQFHTDTMAIDKAVDMDLEAGKTYFVRTGLRVGVWAGTWYLSRVYDEEALSELQSCCKSGG